MDTEQRVSTGSQGLLVRDIMTANPVTVPDTSPIQEAAKMLTRQNVSGLPVVDSGDRVIGFVSEIDLFSKDGEAVRDVMSRGIISVSPGTSVDIVSQLLTDHRIRRLPVIDGNKLVGIVSRADIVRSMQVYWICTVCGETVHDRNAPDTCPKCGARDSFNFSLPNPGD